MPRGTPTWVRRTSVDGNALGTTLPMVRDAGLLGSRLGARILAFGEFGPIIAVALLHRHDLPVRRERWTPRRWSERP